MKNDKNKKTQRSRVSDFDALNSQLGSFDIEPPKVYRDSTEQRRVRQSSVQNRTKSKRDNKSSDKRQYNRQRNNINTRPISNQDEIKKRKKKNLKLKIVRAVAIVVVLLIILIVLSLTVIFKIDTITVTGNEKYSSEEILAVLPIQKEDNLFLADINESKDQLEETLPYIYNAEIKRKFPTTITVKITEVSKIYSIKNQDKSYTLLDENLKVLETNTAKLPKNTIKIDKLTLVSTISGQMAEIEKEQQKNDLITITSAISRLKLDKITAISSYQVNSNTITYDSRITIRLGTTENIDDKIYASLSAIEKLNETNPGAKGDMTVLDDKQVYFTEK